VQARHPGANRAVPRRDDLRRLVKRFGNACQRRAPMPALLLRQVGGGGDRYNGVGEGQLKGGAVFGHGDGSLWSRRSLGWMQVDADVN
jgi:hypothetical protein